MPMSFQLNAESIDDEINFAVQRGNKFTFKQDQAEVTLGWTVELLGMSQD
jgi:hypothetical protein